MLRTFLVESDDLRVVLQFENASAEEKLQAQSIVPIELVRVKEMSQTVETAIVTIVPSDADVETLDAQPDAFVVENGPRVGEEI